MVLQLCHSYSKVRNKRPTARVRDYILFKKIGIPGHFYCNTERGARGRAATRHKREEEEERREERMVKIPERGKK